MINIIELYGNEPKFQYNKISLIHKESISEGFLASLNLLILIQLYRGFARSEYSKLFIASDSEDNILGFIVVSFSTSKLCKEIIFNQFFKIVPLLLPKIISISFLRKIFETLFYPFKKQILTEVQSELLNFCVTYDSRGKGVGEKLFLRVRNTLKKRNINSMKIVTGKGQIDAQNFYEKHQATLCGTQEIHKGSASLIYQYNINE